MPASFELAYVAYIVAAVLFGIWLMPLPFRF